MFENLQGLGYGLVGFAIIIGIGTVVLHRFGGAVADCIADWSWNDSIDKCCNDSAGNCLGTNATTPTSSGWVNTNYLTGQLGTSGLAGWTPAIIALSVGMLFLGYFMVRKGGGRKA